MTKPTQQEYKFIEYLEGLLKNEDIGRAAMAHLRRGLGKPPGTVFEMDRFVLTQLGENPSTAWHNACYNVAALFAYWHQGKEKAENLNPPAGQERAYEADVNLGKSLQKLVAKQADEGEKREDTEKRLEKRLNALLNADLDDLPDHLRRIISLLKDKDVPVNWPQLLHDIQHWDAESCFIQHDWAKGFWILPRKEDPKTK
jgi:CRISPR system Cascade subunit CasB